LLTHRQTDRQTNKQTNSGKNITSLAEVISQTKDIAYRAVRALSSRIQRVDVRNISSMVVVVLSSYCNCDSRISCVLPGCAHVVTSSPDCAIQLYKISVCCAVRYCSYDNHLTPSRVCL